jgi:hypothetical protein
VGRRYGSDRGCVRLYHEGGGFKTYVFFPSSSFTPNFVSRPANPYQIQESHSRQKWCTPKQLRTTTGSSRRCSAMENSSLLDSLSSRPRGGNRVKGRRTILMCVVKSLYCCCSWVWASGTLGGFLDLVVVHFTNSLLCISVPNRCSMSLKAL